MGVYMDSGAIAFGDGDGALKALKSIFEGGEPGRVLGDGAEATGKAFGVERIPVVKHQALPAYDPRSVQGIGVTYATSTMGADHTAGYSVAANILNVGGDVDPLKPEGQVELSQDLQIATAMLDALGSVHLRRLPRPRHPGGVRRHLRDGLGAHRRAVGRGRADAARQGDARLRAALQRAGGLHRRRRPPAGVLQPRSSRRTTRSSR